MKLYKNKYVIGVYDDNNNDAILCILDNEYEFADFFDIKVSTARVNLHYYFTGEVKTIRFRNRYYSVHFIRIDE